MRGEKMRKFKNINACNASHYMASKCTLNLLYGVELRLWISNYVGTLILGLSGFQTSGRVYPTQRWERPLVWLKFLGLLKIIFYYILIDLLSV